MVATELHILSDTVEPFVVEPVRVLARRRRRLSLRRWLAGARHPRAVLSCARWLLVASLILSGYFAAAGINAAAQLIQNGGSSQPLIATSTQGQ
jgi:hypothetical protein